MRRLMLGAVAMLLLLSGFGEAAHAYSISGRNWPSRSPNSTYLVNTGVPLRWRTPVSNGRNAWLAASISTRYGGTTSVSDVDDAATHIVRIGSIPSAWQTGCPPASTLACTRTFATNDLGHLHIYDADMVFNTATFAFTTDDIACNHHGQRCSSDRCS
jgi:hypothetical protein